MALYVDSTFELVIQIAVWLVISKNVTLKCSRPDSQDGDGVGQYLMLPRATDSPKVGDKSQNLKGLIFVLIKFYITDPHNNKFNHLFVFRIIISVQFAGFYYSHYCSYAGFMRQ